MQLVELLKDWPCKVKGDIRRDIAIIIEHSQFATSDALFVMHKSTFGTRPKFLQDAIEQGVSVVVLDDEALFDSWDYDASVVWVPNSRTFVANASHRFYGEPSHVLPIVAITGTNGKTTVSHFIGQLVSGLGSSVMVIGTNGVFINGVRDEAEQDSLTTKSAVTLHRLLKKAVEQRIELVVMEASSMGLEMSRLDFCEIDVGVFLNLSSEHIEDHRSLENYKLAKKRLVNLSGQLVCNADDLFCQSIAVKSEKPVKLFSMKGKGDVRCTVLHETAQDSLVKISVGAVQEVCHLPFSGPFLYANLCAAISALLMFGVELEDMLKVVPKLTLPEGRMERLMVDNGVQIIIDYAHTPEAFRQVMQHLHAHCSGELLAVFSCGGGRDQAKREEIGRIASKYADRIILTTDNCRMEDAKTINAQIRNGFFAMQVSEEQLDRKLAIERALELAQPGDTVFIAGKGHETLQLIGDTSIPFSDREVVYELVSRLNSKK